jgi:hypothetical protein
MPTFPTRSEVLNASISEIRALMTTHGPVLNTILEAIHPKPTSIIRQQLDFSLTTLVDLNSSDRSIMYPSLLHVRFAPSLSYICEHPFSESSQIVIHHNGREAGRLQFDPNDLVHPVMRSHLFALFLHLIPGF